MSIGETAGAGQRARAFSPAAVLGWLLIACVAVTFVLTRFTGDIEVFFAAASQARYHGAFPFNVYEAWDLKPIGNRIVVYVVYQLVSHVVDFADKPRFELAVKVLLAIAALAVSWWSAPAWRRVLRERGLELSRGATAIGVAALLLAVSYNVPLQPEWDSTLIVIAAMPLAVSDRRAANVAAGLLLALLLPLKVISLSMAAFVVIILLALGPSFRQRLYGVVAGTVLGSIAIATLVAVAFPRELTDFRFATQLALEPGALLEGKRLAIYRFLHDSLHVPEAAARLPVRLAGDLLDRSRWLMTGLCRNAMPNVPILAAGAFSLVALAAAGWRTRRHGMVWPSVALWGIGLAIVLAQRRYFPYHYFVLAVPAGWSIVELLAHRTHIAESLSASRRARWVFVAAFLAASLLAGYEIGGSGVPFVVAYAACVAGFALAVVVPRAGARSVVAAAIATSWALALAMWLFFVSPASAHFRTWTRFRNNEARAFTALDRQFALDAQPSIVYLDDGRSAYYIGEPSYERYFSDVPLWRSAPRPGDAPRPMYTELLARLLAYRGEYVVISVDDLTREAFRPVRDKLDREYRVAAEFDLVQEHNYPVDNPWTFNEATRLYRRR